MNDLPSPNETNQQQVPHSSRSKQFLFWCGFIALMLAFFFGGYYLTDAYRSVSAPTTPARVDIAPENDWEQLPPPSRPKKITAKVEVSEISPKEPKPDAEAETPSSSDEQHESASAPPQEQDNAGEITPAPTPARQPTPKPAPTPPVDNRRYVIQMGIYAERDNAEIISANLADHGYASSIRLVTRNGAPHYQVIVGNPKSKAAADALAAELRKAGREVAITPVD